MIPFTSWLAWRSAFARPSDWASSCLAGAPVPDPEACADCDTLSLAVGGAGTVSCLLEPASAASVKLAALGILPGVRIRVVQRHPAHVIRIGYTEIALDAALAVRVRIRVGEV
jgi:Fe2+ transport system protein FeoA